MSKFRNPTGRFIESRLPAKFSTVLDLAASFADPAPFLDDEFAAA
jgi:hypothetical protein